ncbi:VOC family protein [Ancylomarina euxinus]|uniref:VOC family protein n=1 Tax=Ancylomarina euxinus TaxID=2283627 RepID=UPI0018CFC85C|nr:hypothetical protein [Ancylomarina euxinus]MCZ4696005.1 hypothetical protein [Ancylomarina euxinus]
MGSDTSGEWAKKFIQGNNFSVSISTDSKVAADEFFNKLSADVKVIMAMDNTFWGSYFGMFVDKFGIQWMIGYDDLH